MLERDLSKDANQLLDQQGPYPGQYFILPPPPLQRKAPQTSLLLTSNSTKQEDSVDIRK